MTVLYIYMYTVYFTVYNMVERIIILSAETIVC